MKALTGVILCAAVLLVSGNAAGQVLVNGAGATFPYPIYSKWFDEFHTKNSQAQINYQSVGSGAGIRQLQAGTVDFGASDSPMTDEQLSQAPAKVLHFPTVLGAVVATYNLAGVKQEINFTPEALAGIFLGTVSKWNDPILAKANPGVTFPAADIVVVHRSDGSGTTFVWTDYLSKASPAWKSKVGAGTAVNWPVGLGAKGNEGVSGLVKQTPNSIGYVELVYALQNKMAYARVRNTAGSFVRADLRSVTAAAAAAAAAMPDDFRVSITNPPGKDAYPISSFTWLLVPVKIQDSGKRKILTDFLHWMLQDGQKMAEPLGYAPLPKAVVAKEVKTIAQIQ
jgi:phosphate transport system substrate-binding protein